MSEAVWNEVECGGYGADLPLWEELAAAVAPGDSILELGCGSGRVSLHLADRSGRRTVGVDRDPVLVDAVRARGGEAVQADVRRFGLAERFGLVLAPMQLIQLLEDAEQRRRCLACVAAHLGVGGRAAFAIVEELSAPGDGAPVALPDVREIDGRVYSSLPLEAEARGGGSIVLRRLRQTVSPDGEFAEELDRVHLQRLAGTELEAEGEAVGLQPAGRREIPATEFHVGSSVVLLEAVA